MLHLRIHPRSSWLVCRRSLRRLRAILHAASAAVAGARVAAGPVVVEIVVSAIAGIVVSAIAGAITVDVADRAHIDVVVHAVVEEVAAVPVAALIAEANVAEAVVDAAVEADVQAPMAGIEEIAATVKAPVARRPKRGCVGRLNPRSRHPVIAFRSPGPVAGGPDVAVCWRRGLFVVGKRRRSFCCLLSWHLSVASGIVGALPWRGGRLVWRRSFCCVGRSAGRLIDGSQIGALICWILIGCAL